MGWPADESLLCHPEIVIHLRKVLVAVVGDESDDALLLRLSAAIAKGSRQQRAGR
jgi:hypothetical protein